MLNIAFHLKHLILFSPILFNALLTVAYPEFPRGANPNLLYIWQILHENGENRTGMWRIQKMYHVDPPLLTALIVASTVSAVSRLKRLE